MWALIFCVAFSYSHVNRFRQSLERTIETAKAAHDNLMDYVQVRELRTAQMLVNMAEFLNIGRLYGVDAGRRTTSTRLTRDQQAVVATIMNQAGVASESVLRRVQLRNENGRYRFERCRRLRPGQLGSSSVSGDSLDSDGDVENNADINADNNANAANADSTSADNNDNTTNAEAGQDENEMADIRRSVLVSKGPRGQFAIRSKNGSLRKTARSVGELYRYVECNIPDWRQSLSCQ